MNAFIPYGRYGSTPFAKWQGSLANMNALPLATKVGLQACATSVRALQMAAQEVAGGTVTSSTRPRWPMTGRFKSATWSMCR